MRGKVLSAKCRVPSAECRVPSAFFRIPHSTFHILPLLASLFSAQLWALDSETEVLNMAMRIESELTGVIDRASSAFAFVGGGSGVVISADGYILTNHHVAGDRKQWTVRIYGTSRLHVCDLIGTDPVGDLCLLKAREAVNLPFIEFGDISKLQVGQQCLSIGDPFKLADTLDGPPAVSLGTISALHRFQKNYSDAIQTDAAINKGNSGGPLVTLDDKLIGITGQIISRFGAISNTGIGYAIPIDQVERFIPVLKAAGGSIVYHGMLPDGLEFKFGSQDDAQSAVVQNVELGSDARRWGFKAGDIVISVDDKPVLNYWRLRGIVQSYPENAMLKIIIQREGKQYYIPPQKLPRKPLPPGKAHVLGMKVDTLTGDEDITVARVDANSPAEKAGILVDDVIVKISGRAPVLNWEKTLLSKRPGEQIPLVVRRVTPTGQALYTLTLSIEN